MMVAEPLLDVILSVFVFGCKINLPNPFLSIGYQWTTGGGGGFVV